MTTKSIRWAFNFSKWSPSEPDMLLATACIQPEEKERLARFAFKKEFIPSLIGMLLRRKFVHEATAIPYNEIKFGRNDTGKPILISPVTDDSTKLAFNVSHHGNFVVLAGEIGSTVLGADVMKLEYSGNKSLKEYFRIMRKPFSEMEWAEIEGSGSEKNQIAMFRRHWCLKESYVKAIGIGIRVNLRNFSFKTNTQLLQVDCIVKNTELYIWGLKQNWTFEEALLDNEHCTAVALNNHECSNVENNAVFSHLDFPDIVKDAVPLLPYDELYCKSFFQKSDALYST